jgi:hypothetical protein
MLPLRPSLLLHRVQTFRLFNRQFRLQPLRAPNLRKPLTQLQRQLTRAHLLRRQNR